MPFWADLQDRKQQIKAQIAAGSPLNEDDRLA